MRTLFAPQVIQIVFFITNNHKIQILSSNLCTGIVLALNVPHTIAYKISKFCYSVLVFHISHIL